MIKLEEALLQLNEDELFGKEKSVAVEQSEVLKNLGVFSKMLQEIMDIIISRDVILYDDAMKLSDMQKECMKWIGEMQFILEKYII